jgi:hypothetical protein
MNITRKFVTVGAVAIGVFALGSVGASAVAHNLTVEDRPGVVQKIAPVTTGTTVPTPSSTPFDDKSVDPTGTITVAPADPTYVDDHGVDGPGHDVGDDNGGDDDGISDDGAGHDVGDDHGGSGSTSSDSGSGSSTSGSGGSDDSGSGSGHGGGSDDSSGHH